MSQIQCPNCGGYRVRDWHSCYLDPQTGEKVRPRSGCLVAAVALLVVVIELMFVPFLVFGAEEMDRDTRLIAAVVMLVVGGLIVIAVFEEERLRPRWETLISEWKYECEICGYEWSWREDQPRPRATVRPDLIRKGHRRIEEEERERELWD